MKIFVIITNIDFSYKVACWVCRLSSVPLAVISCVIGNYIFFPQTRNDNTRGCVMPGRPLLSHYMGIWTLYCRLPWTGAPFLYCAGLVCKVCHSLSILFPITNVILMFLQRCRAPSGQLDNDEGGYDRRSKAHTDYLCTRCEMSLLYENYGIIGDIIVCILPSICKLLYSSKLLLKISPLQMNFHVLTYTNF